MRNQRRVEFDLPKHIYRHYESKYYFRLTRRPHRYHGKVHDTIEGAVAELNQFLLNNPDKAPRFNGSNPAQCRTFHLIYNKRKREARGKK